MCHSSRSIKKKMITFWSISICRSQLHTTMFMPVLRHLLSSVIQCTLGLLYRIYFDAFDALENVCDIRGAHVRSFPTLATAVVGWRWALSDGCVIPLGDVSHTLLSRYFCYTVPAALEHKPTQVDALASDDDILVGKDNEWHRAAYEHGPKWVVWKGRLPGVLDTWQQAHAEIHGLMEPQDAYQKFTTHTAALAAWEMLAAKGYMCKPMPVPNTVTDDKYHDDLVGCWGLTKSIECPSCGYAIEVDCTFIKSGFERQRMCLMKRVCFEFASATHLVMPFPRRYKTKEDKKAANRLKNKRYYDRNRKAILQSWQQKRVAAEEANTVTSSVMVHVADSSENCSHSHLEKWKDHAVQAVAYLDKVVGISNMKYLDGLCKKFASELTAN
ncbi:hypothetical protein L208DRAFT_1521205 [Tricholoma matsutake]|nr:hypothetical protein L208DRAFT_1521205 [Tricholoma matsutake 945]